MLPPVRPAVLLVDDDLTLLSVLSRRVSRAGYDVRTANSGSAALKQLDEAWPALMVIDLMMPGMDGFELSRRVKQIADLPIIILSAVDASEAKVSALEHYAEDYVTKPFDPDELVARIQRVLRRASIGSPQISLDGGEVSVDLANRVVTTSSGAQQLTRTEARLLHVLAASIDRVVPTEQLLDRVWTDSDGADPSYLWVTVRRLRRKLEPDPDAPRYLLTERGLGYRLSSGSGQQIAALGGAAHWLLALGLRWATAGGDPANRRSCRCGPRDRYALARCGIEPAGRSAPTNGDRVAGDSRRRLRTDAG